MLAILDNICMLDVGNSCVAKQIIY